MKILKNIPVPTGNICIAQGEKGRIEFLSIGDYGQHANIKADFLGLSNEINGVENGEIMPLSEKWVITTSTQYGCSMDCKFCDVPKVGKGKNATKKDLVSQFLAGVSLHPEVKETKRLNLHFARMGEPTWNPNILDATEEILHECAYKNFKLHPVISTMMPKRNRFLKEFLTKWIEFKNSVDGEAGLQLSINTTDEAVRSDVMPKAMGLKDISDMMCDILQYTENGLKGRKIALNIALTDAEVDARMLYNLFSPNYFMVKITPMHLTDACVDNALLTKDGYTAYHPYKQVEENLKRVGFDVLVFIPSEDEDKSRITCGNAILSGTMPEPNNE